MVMGLGNVSERRAQPPQVGLSVVILALGQNEQSNNDAASHDHDSPSSSRLWIPLVRRVKQPFRGAWALPGGHLQSGRSLEQAAFDALESTTDLHPRYLEQLYTFGDPSRSQGGLPMVSIVYWALVGQGEAKTFTEADNVKWFPEDQLPQLAFDHRTIIDYALWRLRDKIEYPDVATKLVGDEFTLAQLHSVYEAITGQSIDLANFRRKMLASGELEPTGEKRREGRHRPAAVYRYVPNNHADSNAVNPLTALGIHTFDDESHGRAANASPIPESSADSIRQTKPADWSQQSRNEAIEALTPSGR